MSKEKVLTIKNSSSENYKNILLGGRLGTGGMKHLLLKTPQCPGTLDR